MNESAVKAISDWLDENLMSIDPGTDEIANLIINKMLEDHSCCDAQTFQFCDELYKKTIIDDSPDNKVKVNELKFETGDY